MKCVIFALMLVTLSLVQGQGFPTKKCPPGEHSVLYCPQKGEPSCDNPTVHKLFPAGACDIPHCFCNTPTVRNRKTGRCVKLTDC